MYYANMRKGKKYTVNWILYVYKYKLRVVETNFIGFFVLKISPWHHLYESVEAIKERS